MIEIIRGENWVLSLYPPESENPTYKLSDYAIIEKCDDGYLLLHTLTWSLFLLSQEELDNVLHFDYLKKYNIVLDDTIDELKLAEEVYLKRSEFPVTHNYEHLGGYVIFTTNNCNAQCFYCYEKDKLPPIGMTLKTAEDVVQFILRTHKRNFNIQWFGGEPLLNQKVIDHITNRLNEENIEYTTTMISNSLLFNEDAAEKAKNQWHLKNVQITIDGLGETYNKIKNYKNNASTAFDTLINNIDNILTNTDIHVTIRVNVSEDNANDIENLIVFLKSRFKEFFDTKKINIGLSPIFQLQCDDTEIDGPVYQKIKELRDVYNIHQQKMFLDHKRLHHCMADAGSTVAINPLGYFAPCEHWYDEHIIGHINSGVTNTEVIEKWRKKGGENIKYCIETKCKYFPLCEHYNMCEAVPVCNNETRRKYIVKNYREALKFTYEEYLKRVKNIKETNNGEE